MKQVYFYRSFLLEGDSRSQKMIEDYRKRDYSVCTVVWTRGRELKPAPDSIAFNGSGLLGGRAGNALFFLRWHWFIAKTIFARRKTDALIHCVDFDTAIVCVPLAKIFRKKVIFDGFDHFASSRDFAGIGFRIFHKLEKLLCRAADVCILPDEARRRQYELPSKNAARDNVRIIGNIPTAAPASKSKVDDVVDPGSADGNILTLCYVGTLEALHRGLEYIPDLCRKLEDRIRFVVAGIGELDEFFKNQSEKLPNLEYLGAVPYDRALQIMSKSDVLYGPYLLSSANHRFASPNKMYEHMMLGKCLLTNEGTPVADFVEQNGTGLLFDGSLADLERAVISIEKSESRSKGSVARQRWEQEYQWLRERQVQSYFEELA